MIVSQLGFLEAIPGEHPEVFIVATQIAFTQVVRDTLSGAQDAAITEASSTGPLRDGEGRIIPVWVVEAAIRHALGELSAIEGISPDLVLDAHFAFVWSWIGTHPLAAENVRRLTRDGLADFHEAARARAKTCDGIKDFPKKRESPTRRPAVSESAIRALRS